MTNAELANLLISLSGVAVAFATLAYSARLTQRSNRISSHAAKLASEHESIKRALKSEVVHRLIAIYQNIKDFNDYLWLVLKERAPVSADFVASFYLRKAEELSVVRSEGKYFEYTRARDEFKRGRRVSSDEIAELLALTSVSESEQHNALEVFAGAEIGIVIGTLLDNTWWSLLDTAQKLRYNWPLTETEDEGEVDAKSHLLAGRDAPETLEILFIMRRAMHFMGRVELLLALLKKYEPELTAHIHEMYRVPDIE